MLKQRVITAVVLLVILVGAMLSGYQWPFGLLLSLITAAALWEWLRLSMANRFHFLAAPIAVVAFLYFVYVIFRHEQYLFVSGAKIGRASCRESGGLLVEDVCVRVDK